MAFDILRFAPMVVSKVRALVMEFFLGEVWLILPWVSAAIKLLQLLYEVFARLAFKVAIVEFVDEAVFVLVVDVLLHKLRRLESFVANAAAILGAFYHSASLLHAVDVLHLHQEGVFLWIDQSLIRPCFKHLVCRSDILAFLLPSSSIPLIVIVLRPVHGEGRQAQMLGAALGGQTALIFTPEAAVQTKAVHLAEV